jgi:F420-0:gamma-glutamyl ligase-like protein
MTSIDNLLKLSTELSKLGSELTEVGGKLAQAAATLQQEAANIAEEMSRQWGVDVSVNVGVRPGGVIRRDVVVANGGGGS